MGVYYSDEYVTLYHGDCRDIDEWRRADVLLTDPPYGIGWEPSGYRGSGTAEGIRGDGDTAVRDLVLDLFGDGPAVVFGTPNTPPARTKHTLVWAKPPDSGIFGAYGGWRRDWEAIYLVGSAWSPEPARRSSVLRSSVSSLATYTKRGHPHGKPIDLVQALLAASPVGAVADPFAGSGTTLVAAKQLGRPAIGVELDERYCEVAASRLTQDVLPFGA